MCVWEREETPFKSWIWVFHFPLPLNIYFTCICLGAVVTSSQKQACWVHSPPTLISYLVSGVVREIKEPFLVCLCVCVCCSWSGGWVLSLGRGWARWPLAPCSTLLLYPCPSVNEVHLNDCLNSLNSPFTFPKAFFPFSKGTVKQLLWASLPG